MSAERVTLQLIVNGTSHRVSVPPMKRLLDVLREECGLTGTKEGCGEGECGTCSVRMNGTLVNSCLVGAVQCDGARVTTVEGLARGPRLSALQTKFVELGGAQCGICTPGMLVASVALLEQHKGRVPSDEQVREALSGNLCRCTGYQKIVDAVRAAAREMEKAPARKPDTRSAVRASASPKARAKRATAPQAKASAKKRPR